MATSEIFTKLFLLLFCHLSYLWICPKIRPDWPTQLLSPALHSVIPAQEKLLPEHGAAAEMGHMPWIQPTSSGLILDRCREDRDLTVPASRAVWRRAPSRSSRVGDTVTGMLLCTLVLAKPLTASWHLPAMGYPRQFSSHVVLGSETGGAMSSKPERGQSTPCVQLLGLLWAAF